MLEYVLMLKKVCVHIGVVIFFIKIQFRAVSGRNSEIL